MQTFTFTDYYLFLMVFARMTGMILFHPIFGRRNIPPQLRVGFAFILAFLIKSTLTQEALYFRGAGDFLFACLKELLIGFAVSFVFQMFLSVYIMAGEMIDMQIGIGMSKVYDPHSNISMPLTGEIFNLMYVLMFFMSNSHLTFLKIMALTFDIVPAGTAFLNYGFANYLVMFFGNILVLAVKLALPIIAIEVISEIGMGVIMRTVPQINVFTVGIQLKLLVGMIVIGLILPVAAGFFDSMTNEMMKQVTNSLKLLSAT